MMEIVPATGKIKEYLTLSGMLETANIPKDKMCFDKYPTFCFVTDFGTNIRGFYTEKQDEEGLVLKHFIVEESPRDSQVGLKLWLHFKKRHKNRIKMFSVNISKANQKLKKGLENICTILEKYHSDEYEDFYLVSFRR